MKTKDELAALKAEMETLSKKLTELTDDELEQVIGGQREWKTLSNCTTWVQVSYDLSV